MFSEKRKLERDYMRVEEMDSCSQAANPQSMSPYSETEIEEHLQEICQFLKQNQWPESLAILNLMKARMGGLNQFKQALLATEGIMVTTNSRVQSVVNEITNILLTNIRSITTRGGGVRVAIKSS